MPDKKPRKSKYLRPSPNDRGEVVGVRIIAGTFRGRKLRYSGDLRTRPMKDRLRQAIFNILGPAVAGKHAIDLFAGTGALGLETVSRGAVGATFVEQHYPTARLLQQSIDDLGATARCEIVTANTFIWAMRNPALPTTPWVVLCSPPYEFYVSRHQEMLDLVGGLFQRAPAGSLFVVESDARFDPQVLPMADAWDVRAYPPAVVAIVRKPD